MASEDFDDDDKLDGGPGEHDRHLMDGDDEPELTVKCSSCGQRIWADAERCPKCGALFAEAAWKGQKAGELPSVPGWIWWTAIALLAAFLVWFLPLW